MSMLILSLESILRSSCSWKLLIKLPEYGSLIRQARRELLPGVNLGKWEPGPVVVKHGYRRSHCYGG